jgi:maltose alpha-D-glucosyltransferase/alpha-amylase
MQWTDGPNAGFSSAPKKQLTDPVIEDEVYGYAVVNVRAQEADPDSLLNWTRRLLSERKRRPAFGRGTLQLLSPENRAILAYVRAFEGETVLVVNNLSSKPQEAGLDLSAFVGTRPVDLFTQEKQPPVGQETPMRLGAYGYRWLKLA